MCIEHNINLTSEEISQKLRIRSKNFNVAMNYYVPKYVEDKVILKIFETVESFPKPYLCRAMIFFMLRTGCCESELYNIKVKDFDVNNNLIYINQEGRNKVRRIPMFNDLKVEILDYLKTSGMDQWNSNCEGYLFASDEGLERKINLTSRTIEHLIERIRNKLPELTHLSVSSFQHTFQLKILIDELNNYNQ